LIEGSDLAGRIASQTAAETRIHLELARIRRLAGYFIEYSMRKSTLLLATGFVLGFGLGFFVWQNHIGNRLREENARLLAQSKDAESLRDANAKLTSERVDPDELKRLRDTQTELLRLRGQVVQLRQRISETPSTAISQSQSLATTNQDLEASPVETYAATASAKLEWNSALVTGGWKLPSGKRALVFLQPTPEATPNTVNVRARIVEVPDETVRSLPFLEGEREANGNGMVPAAAAAVMFADFEKKEGTSVISSPSVTTLSGRQAQIAVTESFTGPDGKNYSTGPVIDLIPTISPDGQSVALSVELKLNVRRLPK
jgi:hypothetical protein